MKRGWLKSLDRLRGHPLFMSAHIRAGAVSRTEDASGGQVLLLARHASENASRTPVGCPQSVESAVRGPLKMRCVPQEPVFGTEYLFRTVEACFLHRMLLKMRRVPQEAFLSTARIFRTIGGPLRYRMPTTQPPSHHSTPSTPVPNTRQRQVAAAAEPGEHFSRPHFFIVAEYSYIWELLTLKLIR